MRQQVCEFYCSDDASSLTLGAGEILAESFTFTSSAPLLPSPANTSSPSRDTSTWTRRNARQLQCAGPCADTASRARRGSERRVGACRAARRELALRCSAPRRYERRRAQAGHRALRGASELELRDRAHHAAGHWRGHVSRDRV